MTRIDEKPERLGRTAFLFTVVIPTLNRCETLKDTLESCVREAAQGPRTLVSDNLSDDRTHEIVREFAQRDSRVSCVQPPARQGVSRHWKFAITQVQDLRKLAGGLAMEVQSLREGSQRRGPERSFLHLVLAKFR